MGDIVVSEEVRYHDADVTAFGYEPGQMAGCPAAFVADDALIALAEGCIKQLDLHAVRGLICSGDAFINGAEPLARIRATFPRVAAVEMEAAAIAHVCHLFGTPFVVVRAISDVADSESHMSFDEFLVVAAKQSTLMVNAMLQTRPSAVDVRLRFTSMLCLLALWLTMPAGAAQRVISRRPTRPNSPMPPAWAMCWWRRAPIPIIRRRPPSWSRWPHGRASIWSGCWRSPDLILARAAAIRSACWISSPRSASRSSMRTPTPSKDRRFAGQAGAIQPAPGAGASGGGRPSPPVRRSQTTVCR